MTGFIKRLWRWALALILTTPSAMAVSAICEISPKNSYEFIVDIEHNGVTMNDGDIIAAGDTLTLTPGYSGYAYRDNWSIWLDLNNDGDFADSGEQVFSSSSASNQPVPVVLNIPQSSAALGTNMRVLLHANDVNDDSCGYNGWGDSRDFRVNIGDATSPSDALQNNNPVVISGTDFHTSLSVPNDATDLSFSLSGGSGDADLYVYYQGVLRCFLNRGGNEELCDTSQMGEPQPGSYDIEVLGYRSGVYNNVTLLASYSTADNGGSSDGDGDGDGEKLYGSQIKWEHDNVRVKVYRFEFNDVKLSWSKTAIQSDMDLVASTFDKESYGRFNVSYEIYNQVISVGQNKSVYDNGSSWDWIDYYEAKLTELGETQLYNIDDNTIYLIIAPQISNWGPKAGPVPGAIRIYDDGDTRTKAGGIIHEMGHAMGLHHAEAIDGGRNVFGDGNFEDEKIGYGNVFSMMGNNAWDFGGFNLYYKNHFTSWNIEASAPQITQSGTYRIYALDQGAIGGNIGLRLKSGNGDYTYWVEYRTRDGADTNGVQINIADYMPDYDTREYFYGTSYLLDMTPNSIPFDPTDEIDWNGYDMSDAALLIGKSYSDNWGGFTITPVAKGGELGTPDAWIDVEVVMH